MKASLRVATLLIVAVLVSSCKPDESPLACHNQLAGAPMSDWNLNAAGDTVAAFTDKFSYAAGEEVQLLSNHRIGEGYDVRVYRLGHYQGAGARLMGNGRPYYDASAGSSDYLTLGSWSIPSDAPSGLYMGVAIFPHAPRNTTMLLTSPTEYADHVEHTSHFRERPFVQAFFTVRPSPEAKLDVLYRVSETVWAASSASSDGHRYTLAAEQAKARLDPATSVFSTEWPTIKFLESLGFEVGYIATSDVEQHTDSTPLLQGARLYMQAGSDVGRSVNMRRFLRELASLGVHRAFLGVAGAAKRLIWDSDYRGFQLTDEKFEEAVADTGSRLAYIQWHAKPLTTPHSEHLAWTHTRVARFNSVSHLHRQVLGRRIGQPWPPIALHQSTVSTTPLDWSMEETRYGLRHAQNVSHTLSLQRHPVSRALTFHANSDQFAHGLDEARDHVSPSIDTPFGIIPRRVHVERDPQGAEPALQQLLLNVFSLMGLLAKVHLGLQVSAASRDANPPTCSFVMATVAQGKIKVKVTAADAEGLVTDVLVRLQGTDAFVPLTAVGTVTTRQPSTWTGSLAAPSQILPEHRLECFATDDSVNTNLMPALAEISEEETNRDL